MKRLGPILLAVSMAFGCAEAMDGSTANQPLDIQVEEEGTPRLILTDLRDGVQTQIRLDEWEDTTADSECHGQNSPYAKFCAGAGLVCENGEWTTVFVGDVGSDICKMKEHDPAVIERFRRWRGAEPDPGPDLRATFERERIPMGRTSTNRSGGTGDSSDSDSGSSGTRGSSNQTGTSGSSQSGTQAQRERTSTQTQPQRNY